MTHSLTQPTEPIEAALSHYSINRRHAKKIDGTATAAAIPVQKQKTMAAIPSFDLMPDSAFIRESQLVQSPKRPDHPAPLPFSAPTLWRKVKAGTFPKPIKLSERVTCWKVSEVRAWMTAQAVA